MVKTPQQPTGLVAWMFATRPKTLSLAAVPVVVGSGLALAHGHAVDLLVFLATLVAALTILIATNLFNDALDGERGLDDPQERLGPARAVGSGWLPASTVRRAALLALGLAFLSGLYLVSQGGWPILAIGLASILASIAYSAGPAPISRTPMGELLVILFFGVLAVAGSYYLQTGELRRDVLLAGLAIGLPAAAVLMVNNYRDLERDRQAGRRTLAILLGPAAARLAYALLLILPFALLSLAAGSAWQLLPLLALPWAGSLVRQIYSLPVGRGLNRLLAATAACQALLGLLLCLGWWLQARA